MEHLKEFKEYDESLFDKFTDVVKNLLPGLKKAGEDDTISKLKDLVQHADEKEFLKQQSGDIIKAIATVGISGIPVPFPITPLLIIVGKKYNFNVLPQDQQHLLDDEMKPTPDKVKDSIFNKTATFVKDTWTATKREGRETKQAMTILERMIKGDKVSDIKTDWT